jgi:hypothetical protein
LEDGLLPENAAGFAVEAEQLALLRVGQGGDRENALAPNDR